LGSFPLRWMVNVCSCPLSWCSAFLVHLELQVCPYSFSFASPQHRLPVRRPFRVGYVGRSRLTHKYVYFHLRWERRRDRPKPWQPRKPLVSASRSRLQCRHWRACGTLSRLLPRCFVPLWHYWMHLLKGLILWMSKNVKVSQTIFNLLVGALDSVQKSGFSWV
jgi:hypothetical protein